MSDILKVIGVYCNKRNLVKEKYTGKKSGDTWSERDGYSLSEHTLMYKSRDKDFTLLNLTDIHFSDCDKRTFMAYPAVRTIKKLVKRVEPDLICVTGDIVCGKSTVNSIKRFTDLMDGFKIPWAPVFGNHDAEGNCDKNYLADVFEQSESCLFNKGDPSLGIGNYIVNIAEKSGDGVRVIHSLIFADTHNSHLNQRQIAWYRWAAGGIERACATSVQSTVFFHIPCAEYLYAYEEAWDSEKKSWRDGYDASGELNEKICCHKNSDGSVVNNGFFKAVKEVGTTKNIICGHDHLNDFSLIYKGVRLTYALKVGEGSGCKRRMNGATVIRISDGGVETENIFLPLI